MTSPFLLTLLVTLIVASLAESASLRHSSSAIESFIPEESKLREPLVDDTSGGWNEVDETDPAYSFREQNTETAGDEDATDDKPTSIDNLMTLLSETHPNQTPLKRTCRFNLGGHCATEGAVNMAKQWHFFNSEFSPGRRRRRSLSKRQARFKRVANDK